MVAVPCKMISARTGQVATEYQGKVKIGKVNIDEHQGLAAQFGVRAIPTLLVIKNGQVSEQMVGAKANATLKASLESSRRRLRLARAHVLHGHARTTQTAAPSSIDQLAAMISAGVPLIKALQMAGKNRAVAIPQKVIQELTRS